MLVKSVTGTVVPDDEVLSEARKFDIKVRTPDKRVILWLGGLRKMCIDQAIDLANKIPSMDVGYAVISVVEL